MGNRIISRTIDLTNRGPDITNKYITEITNEGITIHPEDTSNNNFLRINADGIDIVKNNVVVANYGTTITIGQNNASRAIIDTNGLTVYKGSDNVAEFGLTARIGKEAEGHVKVTSDGIELWGQMLGETDHTFIYSEGISVGVNADQGSIGLGPGGYIEGYYDEIDEDVTENGLRIESNTVNEEEGSSTQAIVRISACGADTAAVISAFIDDSIDHGDGTIGVSSISLEAESISLEGQVQCQEISSLDGTYKEILLGNYSSRAQEVNYALTTSSADNLWLTAALTAICEDYPNYDHTIFKGRLAPNSQGYFEIYIYDTDNTSNGLPQYSYGTWNKWQGTFWIISTNNYSFAYTAK